MLNIKYEGRVFSNNTLYTIRAMPRTGRIARFLSKSGKQFIDDLKTQSMVAVANKQGYPLKGKVKVDMVYYHKGQGCDRDNIGKGIYDAMEGIVFEDDRQVVAGETLKIKHAKNLLYISVSSIDEKTVESKAKKIINRFK